MRILFASTSTNQTTGYGRISFNVISKLASTGHEVHHFAFQNYEVYGIHGDRVLPKSVKIIDVHKLAPAGDTFGGSIWNETIEKVQPELIIVYNDMPVTCSLINEMLKMDKKPCPFISYLDIVYEFQKRELMTHISNYADHIFVFSDFWKIHLMKGFGISHEKISVFPHGIDTQKFSKMDKKEAKVSIGLRPNDFVVFNNNRNSYRKLWDVTLKAFVRFWKLSGCKTNVKLLINCRMDIQDGYNFHDIIAAACINEGVDVEKISNNNIILLSSAAGGIVSDSTVNAAYNSADIGLNTCGGEGFGLCNTEAGLLGVPQIVTRTGGLADIFGGFENMCVDPKVFMSLTSGIDFHNGELAVCDYRDFADKLYFYYKNPEILKDDGQKLEQHIKTTYDWNRLLEQFLKDIERIVS